MKKIVLIIIAALGFLISKAQIILDLGKDTTYCSDVVNPNISKNLKITGDSIGVKYKWYCKHISVTNATFTAENFLNNTTITNPIIISRPASNEWTKFVLELSKNNSVYKDSINIRFSEFKYTLAEIQLNLFGGDSAVLDQKNISAGISPINFVKWETELGILNIYSFPGICKNTGSINEKNIQMIALFKDSVGCIGRDSYYRINFYDTPNSSEIHKKIGIKIVYSNGKILIINPYLKKLNLAFINIDGATYKEQFCESQQCEVSKLNDINKISFLKICDEGSKKCFTTKLYSYE